MKDVSLNTFVERTMKVNADYAGMGGASSAIIGATSTNGQVIGHFRANVMAFAKEYAKHNTDTATLSRLSKQLEGSLYSLKTMNSISDNTFDELLDALYTLLEKVK